MVNYYVAFIASINRVATPGATVITFSKEISTLEDISTVTKYIKDTMGFEGVLVVSWNKIDDSGEGFDQRSDMMIEGMGLVRRGAVK